MAAIPRDGAASSLCPWLRRLRPGLCYRTHSRSTLNLTLEGKGFRNVSRPPLSRRLASERFGDCRDVLGCVAPAPAGNVDQPAARKIAQITGHVFRPQIETGLRKRIRQTGVRIARD